jgi:hypothetical protein
MTKPIPPRLLPVFLVLGLAVLTSCSSPIATTLDTAAQDQLAGVVQLLGRSNNSAISESSVIRLAFTTPILLSSLELSGSLGEAAEPGVSVGSADSVRELELTPAGGAWPLGEDRELVVDAATASRPIGQVRMRFTVVPPVLYVSADRGRYTGAGTVARPFNTPQRAYDFLRTEFADSTTVEVRVAAGSYNTNLPGSADADGLTVPANSRTIGGYSSDFSAQDPELYESRLVSRMEVDSPAIVLQAGSFQDLTVQDRDFVGTAVLSLGGDARLDNVTMDGKDGPVVLIPAGATADIRNSRLRSDSITGVLRVAGGTVTVSNTSIRGGNLGGDVVAVETVGGTLTLQNSSIFTEYGQGSFGIFATESSDLRIEDSVIEQQGGVAAFAISIYDSTLMVRRSVFRNAGGSFATGVSADRTTVRLINTVIDTGVQESFAAAISLTGGSLEIRNSTIASYSGSGNSAVTVDSESGEAVPTLIQNTLFFMPGATGGSFLFTDTPGDIRVENSNFHGPNLDNDIITFTDVVGGTPPNPALVERVNTSFDDPLFANPARLADGGDWRLTASTPVSVTEGGLDGAALGWDFTVDADGVTRTNPWSIGAYEYVP